MGDVPAGLYEHLVTERLGAELDELAPELTQLGALDPADAHVPLTRHVAQSAARAIQAAGGGDDRAVVRQVELANRIIAAIGELVADSVADEQSVLTPPRTLLSVAQPSGVPGPPSFPVRPDIPLSTSALLVNGPHEPRIGHEVQREFASADHVDLLCAFIKWRGLLLIEDAVRRLVARGGRLRVITTTYMGATDQRALDRLVELGAEVKVSYETRTTRLHAKAWLFHRSTGLSTAYVGSSNLSHTAMHDGLEWNVRLSSVEQAHLLATFEETFASYWADASFETYEPTRDGDRLREALNAEKGGPSDLPIQITALDVRPFGYQQEILDKLDAERTVHGHWRNLS